MGAGSAQLLFRVFDDMARQPLPPRTLAPVFAAPPPPALVRLGVDPVAADAPRITFPLAGAQLLAGAEASDVALAASGGRRPYRWLIDGRPLDSRPYARGAAWRPDGLGFSTISVSDAAGRSDEIKVRVVDGAMP